VNLARAAERAGGRLAGPLDRVCSTITTRYPYWRRRRVTDRIRLTTSLLIGPIAANGAVLAKQLASVDRMSDGRLTVGIAVGTREDVLSGDRRGSTKPRPKLQDDLLRRMRAIWRGEADLAGASARPTREGGPALAHRVCGKGPRCGVLIEYGTGWISGGGDPAAFADTAASVRLPGRNPACGFAPRLVALGYFALAARDRGCRRLSERVLTDSAVNYAAQVDRGCYHRCEQLQQALNGFTDAGCERVDLVSLPLASRPGQNQLATAAAPFHGVIHSVSDVRCPGSGPGGPSGRRRGRLVEGGSHCGKAGRSGCVQHFGNIERNRCVGDT